MRKNREALDRGEGEEKGKNIQFPFLSKAREISPFLTVIFFPISSQLAEATDLK